MTKKFYALVTLNVRQAPSRMAERVALLQSGDEIEVIGDPVGAIFNRTDMRRFWAYLDHID